MSLLELFGWPGRRQGAVARAVRLLDAAPATAKGPWLWNTLEPWTGGWR